MTDMIGRLQKLADHLYSLDSDSGEAHLISEALMELRSRSEISVNAEREKVAAWMIRNGFSTGHGDTTEDLLAELEEQTDELRQKREQREILDNELWECKKANGEVALLYVKAMEEIEALKQRLSERESSKVRDALDGR